VAALALVGSLVALTGSASTGGAFSGWGSRSGASIRVTTAAPQSSRGAPVAGHLVKLASSVSIPGASSRALSMYRLGGGGTADATGAVAVGTKPALPLGAKRLGAYPPHSPLSLDIVLRGRDEARLQNLARAVSTPGTAEYRHYLAPGHFATEFGAPAAEVAAVRADLARVGIAAGTVTDGFLLSVQALPSQVRSAFGVSIDRYRLPGGRVAFANTSAPRMTTAVAGMVNGVIGLDDLYLAQPAGLLHGKFHPRAHPLRIGSAAGAPAPCSAAVKTGTNYSGWTANALAKAYSFNGLYAKGDFGAGATVALFELEPYAPSDIAAYQACYGTHVPVANVNVDGGAGTGPGSGEATLDIEDIIGLAPAIKMLVYSAPNSGKGTVDEYASIVHQDKAQVMSSSWGLCEALSGPSIAGAENTIFQQAAVQGQTMLVAAGDSGSEACLPSGGTLAYQAGTGADAVAVDPSTATAYFAASGSSTRQASITVFSEQTASSVSVSFSASLAPEGIAVDPKTHLVFVSLEGSGQVAVLNGATCNSNNADNGTTSGCGLQAVNLGSGSKPVGIAVNSNTGTVYVAESGADKVALLSENAHTVRLLNASISTSSYGIEPFAVAVDVSTNLVYFTLLASPGGVAAANGATCDASSTSNCSPEGAVQTGNEPGGVTVDAGASPHLLIVSNFTSDTVTFLNASNGKLLKTDSLKGFAVGPFGMAVSPTGGSLLVATFGNKGQGAGVVVISLSSGSPTTILASGSGPVAVASDPGQGISWAADEGDGAAILFPLFLGVQDPVDQPYITGVGGTDLTALGPKPTERVWNEASNGPNGAGGGGISSFFGMPKYQAGPGVINSFSTGRLCRAQSGHCREVPDMSASADPLHGYVICYNARGSGTTCPTTIGSGRAGWVPYGGTSAAAPLWAAAIALVDVAQGSLHKVGFINPALYQLEAAHRGVLNDVTLGNNDYTTTNAGRYPATAGYDMASGLGTPIVSAIAAALK
jgi:DNA-binding beta-propeller fold protein YncE